jgi:hypothetical protein
VAQINYEGGATASDSVADGGVVLNRDSLASGGWITDMGIDLKASSSNTPKPIGRLVLYVDNSRAFYGSEITVTDTTYQRFLVSLSSVRVPAGGVIRWGIWQKADQTYTIQNGLTSVSGGNRDLTSATSDTLPRSLWSDYSAIDSTLAGYKIRGTLTYTPNLAPLQGEWRFPPTPTGSITLVSPTFSGTIPQAAGDASLDYVKDVQIQIWDVQNPSVYVYNAWVATTSTERTQGYFEKAPTTLTQGLTYRAKFRTRDSFGVTSPFSAETEFLVGEGGSVVPTAPSGKINVISGYSYQGTYSHANSLNANAVQILVYNGTGTTLLYDSGTVLVTVTPGGTISVPEFHADLTWDSDYTFKIRARDTNNNWSPYSASMAFYTDAAPNAPTQLSPANAKVSLQNTFTAKATDPDGDPIATAQIELVNADTNAVVTGFPKAMSVDAATDTLSYTATTGTGNDLQLNTNYKWRARASDGLGPGFGAWSSYAFFRYAAVPTVTLHGPTAPRTNKIRQPSAEYDPATLTSYWTETARSVSSFVNRVVDDDARFGSGAWEGTAAATGNNRFRAPLEPINGTKAVLLRAWLKKKSGTSISRLGVECYDNASVLLGTIYPSSIAQANGVDVPGAWTEYGGIVWPIGSANTPALPAGTTQVRPFVTPSNASAAVVRFDAVLLEQLAPVDTPANWLEAQAWYGYADPDLGDYGKGGYAWSGAAGDSTSTILPVLTVASPKIVYHYTSQANNAMAGYRVFVDRWSGGAWVPVLNPTAWTTKSQAVNTFSTYTVPSGTLSNEGRFRTKIEAKDTTGLVGSTDYAEFDVRYAGPPELAVQTQEADPLKATIGFTFTPSTLSALDFAGIEVAVESTDGSEPLRIVELVTDPAATRVTYHFPVSGREYRVMARQVQNVGAEQVESRWTVVAVSVDYSGFYFVKDIEDPESLWVKYRVWRDALQSYEREPQEGVFLPWGASEYTILKRRAKPRRGEIEVRFLGDLPGQTEEEGWRKLKEIQERDRVVCLLAHHPDTEKVFAKLSGARAFGSHVPKKRVFRYGWREHSYSEDYYEREGL